MATCKLIGAVEPGWVPVAIKFHAWVAHWLERAARQAGFVPTPSEVAGSIPAPCVSFDQFADPLPGSCRAFFIHGRQRTLEARISAAADIQAALLPQIIALHHRHRHRHRLRQFKG